MDALRVAHFADLHLGVEAGGRANPQTGLNQRIHDVCDRLDELCETVEAEGVHVVLFAGDAFKHQHPTPTLQALFAQRIRRLARAGARVFLLIGNHDLPKMRALSHPFSIYEALEVEGVVVGDRAGVYTLSLPAGAPADEIQIAALPHFSRQTVLARLPEDVQPEQVDERIREAVGEWIRQLADAVSPAAPAVFCGHCHVNQAELPDAQNLFGVSELEVTMSSLVAAGGFAYYALGHIHRHQVLSRDPYVCYSGSLERVDFSEGETFRVAADGSVRRAAGESKGFVRFDLVPGDAGWRLDTEPRFQEVAARRFSTLRLELTGGDDPTSQAIEAVQTARRAGAVLDDAFVRVVVAMDAAERPRLIMRQVRDAIPEAYDVRVQTKAADQEVRVRDPRFATRMTEADALERYLETRTDWDGRDDLLRLGRELINEVLST